MEIVMNMYDDLERQATALMEVRQWFSSLETHFCKNPYKGQATDGEMIAETMRFIAFMVKRDYISYRALRDIKIHVENNFHMAVKGFIPMGIGISAETKELGRLPILPFLVEQINRKFSPEYFLGAS
jgi:hypothetical protein